MKTLLTATALSLGLASLAMAQTTTAPEETAPATPEATTPVTPETTMPDSTAPATPDATAPDATAPAATPDATTSGAVIGMSEAELVGKRVHGADGSDLGEVSAVTLDGSGQVSGVVIDVGGFLGIGEKPVALSADKIQVITNPSDGSTTLSVSMTEEELKALPEHQG